MINEDSQGNVRQLQAEVKKLKELLAAQTSMGLSGRDLAPGGPRLSSSKRGLWALRYCHCIMIS